jgi:hypothetical protein
VDKLDAVVTDDQLPPEMQEGIRELGISMHVAPLS